MERMFEIKEKSGKVLAFFDLAKISSACKSYAEPNIEIGIDGNMRTLNFASEKDRDIIFDKMYNALKEYKNGNN